MKFFLSILIAAFISHSLARGPVRQQSKLEEKVLQLILHYKFADLSELSQLEFLVKSNSDADNLLPRVKQYFRKIDVLFQHPNSISKLNRLKIALSKAFDYPHKIVGHHPSFDNEAVRIEALEKFEYFNLFQGLQLKCTYYELYHHIEPIRFFNIRDNLQRNLEFMHEASALMTETKRGELVSNLYKHKITAEEKMFLDIKRLLRNLPSWEQIDQIITIYEAYSEFFEYRSTPVIRIEGESSARLNEDSTSKTTLNTASSSKPHNEGEDSSNLISDSTSDPEPSSKRRKLNDNPNTASCSKLQNEGEESSQSISDSACNPEPSSNGRKLKNAFPNIFDGSNLDTTLLILAFPKLLPLTTVEIKKKLENWSTLVETNQPIDASEMLSGLRDCIKVMNNIETLIPYSSFFDDELDESFKLALRTVDKVVDLLKDAALSVLPWEYFDYKRYYLPENLKRKSREEFVIAKSILPKEFFDDTTFIEFCINYSLLLLKNNCQRLRGKTVSMVNLINFADQNRPFVDLIKAYQTVLKLRSEDQTATEEQNVVSYNLKARASAKLNKNLDSFLEGPIRPVEEFETFLKANKELLRLTFVDDLTADQQEAGIFWMVHHVPKLLDLRSTDIGLSPDNRLYIKHDSSDEGFESRRLYISTIPSGGGSGHIQSLPTN